jgi:hypothetical protein
VLVCVQFVYVCLLDDVIARARGVCALEKDRHRESESKLCVCVCVFVRDTYTLSLSLSYPPTSEALLNPATTVPSPPMLMFAKKKVRMVVI